MLLSCASKTVLELKFIASRVLATLAQAPIQPTGQRRMLIFAPGLVRVGSAGGAMACPHRGPRACLPMVQRGRRAGGCVLVPGVCSGHTALDRARPKGPAASHPPASPVFYLDLLFPPKPARPRPGRGSRASCSATTSATGGSFKPVPAGLSAGAWGDGAGVHAGLCWEEGTHICVLREQDSGCRTGGWGSEGAGEGAWPWPPMGPSWPPVAVVQLHPSVKQPGEFPA